MNIGGFANRQVPSSVFQSCLPHFLSPPNLLPTHHRRRILSRLARHLIARPAGGAASSTDPPPLCKPGRRCYLLTSARCLLASPAVCAASLSTSRWTWPPRPAWPAASLQAQPSAPPPCRLAVGHGLLARPGPLPPHRPATRPPPHGRRSWRSHATATWCHHRLVPRTPGAVTRCHHRLVSLPRRPPPTPTTMASLHRDPGLG
jgi:hypothetical protein